MIKGFRCRSFPIIVDRFSHFRLRSSMQDVDQLNLEIKTLGDQIRAMKLANQSKEYLEPYISKLKQLKNEANNVGSNSMSETKSNNNPKVNTKADERNSKSDKSVDSFVITSRSSDYSAWYNDVIYASDMVDQSPVRGCMVIKPWGMGVWDLLRTELDNKIKESGTQNAYFPLFIPKSFLAKEAEHVEGFAKECAVVTHHRLCLSPDGTDLIPDPSAKLEEPLIVRPTSETVIWNMFGKWINSYRDLPLKINQWANVVRWEMRTRPFLRTAEFLWQEGHTAHASSEDAIKTALESLDMYATVCENLLAIPTVKGEKSPSERFAGADATYTIEALMQNGWALQSGTSHFLGQNFARAFEVFFQTERGDRELVWATSWGVSTRLIGAMVMTHSDDKGLVLPPRVAPTQVVIVPIMKSNPSSVQTDEEVMKEVYRLYQAMKVKNIRVKVDDRNNLRPGAKYFEWERKGLPLRIEIGTRDVQSNSVTLAFRHNGKKVSMDTSSIDSFMEGIQSALDQMHDDLFTIAKNRLKEKTFHLTRYEDLKARLAASSDGNEENDNGQKFGFFLVPWMCNAENEAKIKEECKATIRCYPFEHNQQAPGLGTLCFYSGQQATHMAIFARAF